MTRLILVIENSLETFWQTYDCLLSKNIKKLAAYTQLSIASLIPVDGAGVIETNMAPFMPFREILVIE